MKILIKTWLGRYINYDHVSYIRRKYIRHTDNYEVIAYVNKGKKFDEVSVYYEGYFGDSKIWMELFQREIQSAKADQVNVIDITEKDTIPFMEKHKNEDPN